MRVLVLGGAGFIGRHAVAALVARGHAVTVASRHPDRADRRLDAAGRACPRRQARLERLLAPDDWRPLIAEVDAVLNCVGILRERGRETYDAVQVRAPEALAGACRDTGLRLVHVSALGLQQAHRSRFLRSKREGERRLLASGADVRIVRPSLLDGRGGYGARWIHAFARLPLHLVSASAVGRIAAFDVADLGEALARVVELPLDDATPADARCFELGGPDAMTMADYLQAVRARHARAPALQLAVPGWLARGLSHACDAVHATPFSFGHHELLGCDNLPQPNRLAELLGRRPRGARATTRLPGAGEPMPETG
jgi:uncharacterized protein YbjT (DUF2867 family)